MGVKKKSKNRCQLSVSAKAKDKNKNNGGQLAGSAVERIKWKALRAVESGTWKVERKGIKAKEKAKTKTKAKNQKTEIL